MKKLIVLLAIVALLSGCANRWKSNLVHMVGGAIVYDQVIKPMLNDDDSDDIVNVNTSTSHLDDDGHSDEHVAFDEE